MSDDYADLLALAEAATPGPWALMGNMRPGIQRITNAAAIVIAETFYDDASDAPDAAYIAAASPDVVARLCRQVAAVRALHYEDEGFEEARRLPRCICDEDYPCATIRALGAAPGAES